MNSTTTPSTAQNIHELDKIMIVFCFILYWKPNGVNAIYGCILGIFTLYIIWHNKYELEQCKKTGDITCKFS